MTVDTPGHRPEILAPAGDLHSILAAVAAGADAVYCGLKIFSARMEADNFSIEELSRLTRLARRKNVKVYLAFNTLIKEGELVKAWKIMQKICSHVACDALIVQDPALVLLAAKAGFDKEIHLSTLGNCTSASALAAAHKAGFDRVVLPREFTIDDIKAVAAKAPQGMPLEVFIHGALCYAVSGRCYWSSWFGGKSGLRGRCVQPCRRIYTCKEQRNRYFSCMDFSADVLVKVLKDIDGIGTWKIEGRKKSPHYVYYTVKAYRMLRDQPELKKKALGYLDYALSRNTTHYRLLSQRPQDPLDHTAETGSGLFTGRIKNPYDPYFITREALSRDDLLRIGYEDDDAHKLQRVTRAVPAKGKFFLNKGTKGKIQKGTPVFIIDRREQHLKDVLQDLEQQLEKIDRITVEPAQAPLNLGPLPRKTAGTALNKVPEMLLFSGKSIKTLKSPAQWVASTRIDTISSKAAKRNWWWLDPVMFPEDESIIRHNLEILTGAGARKFVLNTPWQTALFDNPERFKLWAGPFCNIANTLFVRQLKDMGFSGAIVSPELDRETFLSLPEKSTLPLGIVVHGNWPLAISRTAPMTLPGHTLFTSPMGEGAWITRLGNSHAVFPQWCLDLREKREELMQAGYSLFVYMEPRPPKGILMKKRPGLWNWDLRLL